MWFSVLIPRWKMRGPSRNGRDQSRLQHTASWPYIPKGRLMLMLGRIAACAFPVADRELPATGSELAIGDLFIYR